MTNSMIKWKQFQSFFILGNAFFFGKLISNDLFDRNERTMIILKILGIILHIKDWKLYVVCIIYWYL